MKQMGKRLRSGFTTGACAAAASKAALLLITEGIQVPEVEIPFPDGTRHSFRLHTCRPVSHGPTGDIVSAQASVIKDAGDDPDVTNGAEIIVEARFLSRTGEDDETVVLRAGDGVGTVTRPGLPVPPGRPAINPGPARMIRAAVKEVLDNCPRPPAAGQGKAVEITISVKDGELLAEKTLNRRLGIKGGISILGTTGIVRPVSAKAWTDTIDASMNVARAAGSEEVLLSTGRTSERCVQELLHLPEEAQVMMGDYLSYALRAAGRHGFSRIHLAGMWAKALKAALEIPQTHVRNGVLEIKQAVRLLRSMGLDREEAALLQQANTAREIFQRLRENDHYELIRAVCNRARQFAMKESGLPVTLYLVTSEEGVVEIVGQYSTGS